ncbi:hypothetical protein B0H16DRAFT_1330588, partial [Mycena metata]
MTAAIANTPLPGATPPPGVAFKDTPEERNSRALGVLQKYLAADLKLEYLEEPNAGVLWAKLRQRFEEENSAHTATSVLSDLFATKLVVEGDPELVDKKQLADHVALVTGYFDRLARLKYPFPPDLQPLILLGTLPQDSYWTGIRGNIVSSQGSKITLDKVRSLIIDLGKKPSTESDTALAATGTSKAKSSALKHCLHHGQNSTHSSDECRNLKALSQSSKKASTSAKSKNRKRGSRANASADTDSDSEDSEVDAKLAIATVSAKSYSAFSAYLSSDSE